MKRKEKLIYQIPAPVGGMSSLHPSKFKLSPKATNVGNRKESEFKKHRSIFIDFLLCSNKDIMDLKKLYFKGWLLSR